LPWLQGREGPSETSQVSDPTSSNGAPTSGFGSTGAPSVTDTIRKMMNAHDMRMTNVQKGPNQVQFVFLMQYRIITK
jgi:hypothetical protein